MNKSYIAYKAQGMGFDAHMTIRYFGELTPLQEKFVTSLIKDLNPPREIDVLPFKYDMFGPNKDIPVIRVVIAMPYTNDVHSFYNRLDREWPVKADYLFNPHITLALPGAKHIKIPPRIHLNQLRLY